MLKSFILYAYVCSSQNISITFKNFTDADGLSSNSIQGIAQDAKGFMWFATEDGLNKFDGYKFKAFRHEYNNPNSISQNRIEQVISQNSINSLWLRIGNGTINLFDLSTEKTNRFDSLLPNGIVNKNIARIYTDSDNNLWIVKSSKEIFKIIIQGNTISSSTNYFKYIIPDSLLSPDAYIFSIYEDENKKIWVGDNTLRLIVLTPEKNNPHAYTFGNFNRKVLTNFATDTPVTGGVLQDGENYWIGSLGRMNLVNLKKGVVKWWPIPNGLRGCFTINQNNFWFATNTGIANINRTTHQITYHNYDATKEGSIAFVLTNCIFFDRQDNLWVGTHNGLSFYSKNEKKFFLFRKNPQSISNDLLDNRIRAIAANESSTVWLGTDQKGLSCYNLNANKYVNYVADGATNNKIGSNSYGALFCIKNKVWSSGTLNNVEVIDEFTHKVTSLVNKTKHPDGDVKCFSFNGDNTIWIGTHRGLAKISIIQNRIEDVEISHLTGLSENNIRNIAVENKNLLWLGYENGLLFKLKLDKNEQPVSAEKIILPGNILGRFNNNTINTICLSKNFVWLGCYGGGLKKYDPVNRSFITYLQKDGLANDIVYGLLEDAHSNIWMSTNRGISKFIPATETFVNYTTADGLQGNEYNSGAYFKNKTGWMFFGGTNGWNMFHPDSIKPNAYQPEIVFTDFQIFNRHVDVTQNSFPFKDINYLNEISLSHKQSVFSFEFAALNFTNSLNNKYQYKLEGYDNDWQSTETRRFITFTNLDPGTYILKIKASNNDGVWSSKIKSLRICVQPAWYQTWWFNSLLTLSIIGIISVIVYAYIRFKRIKSHEQRKIREQIKKDLHDDLKSDLAAIQSKAGLVSKVLQRGDKEKAIKRSNEITELTQRALATVDDLSWAFNPNEDSLTEVFKRMKNFIVAIMPEEINYKLETPQQDFDIILPFKTRKHFYLIFKECLYNMVKHSKCKNAFISWKIKSQLLILIINDDGIGFDVENLSRKNGLAHIQERASEINGKLTVLSQPNVGTNITLEIATT